MQYSAHSYSVDIVSRKLVVAGLFEGSSVADMELEALDQTLEGQIKLAVSTGDFKGESGDTLFLYGKTGRVLLIGLGKPEKLTPEKIRRAYGSAGKQARQLKVKDAAIIGFKLGETAIEQTLFLQAALEGFALATYRFAKYRSRDQEKHPDMESLTLVSVDDALKAITEKAVEYASILVDGVTLTRDLGTSPAMDIYPESLAQEALKLAGDSIKVEVLDRAKLEELKMGALLAVGQGSNRPAVMIHLEYDPGIADAKTFAMIGKGITFDAGGLDLKPAAGMRDMKTDMCGAASVLGVFKALEKWKPGCKVHGFIPAAENLTNGWAYKPGDVLTSYKGITIEVDNTDAEGRLAMCDALAYAVDTVKPDAILDIATLTGACVIALGHHGTGMFTNSDELAEVFEAASEPTGERVWRLPIWEEYSEQIKSQVADIKNTGGRPGGASTAAVFLMEFVDDTPWIHLDIAGTASEQSYSYVPSKQYATGAGVRLMLEALKRWSEK